MKHYPPRSRAPPKPRRPRITAFTPVPMRRRKDGWTAWRQAAFIGYLAQTRCVASAAREVGMARETAYRLRRHPWAAGFCAAWDAALARPVRNSPDTATATNPAAAPPKNPKVTNAELRWRFEAGTVRPVMVHRRFVRVVRKPDNTALLQLLRRIDLAENAIARYDAGRRKSQSLKHPESGPGLAGSGGGRERGGPNEKAPALAHRGLSTKVGPC